MVFGVSCAIQVCLERKHRFRLGPIPFEDDGERFVDAREGFVHDLGPDASRQRVRSDAGEPFRERRARDVLGLRKGRGTDDDRRDQQKQSKSEVIHAS